MNEILDKVKDAAIRVLARQGTDLEANAIAALSALPPVCDQVLCDWKSGKIQQIGKPGVPRESGVSKSDISFELSLDESLGLSSLDAEVFIDDVLYNDDHNL